ACDVAGRAAPTQVREDELSGESRAFPDESVPLVSQESVPAKIARGGGTSSRPGVLGTSSRLRIPSGKGRRAAEAALRRSFLPRRRIQPHLARIHRSRRQRSALEC